MKNSVHFQNFIWKEIIFPAIISAKENVDKDFYDNVGMQDFYLNEMYIQYLSELYEEKREWLKKIYFNERSVQHKLLDMHKIAAVICRCLIGCKPFSFDVEKANDYKKVHKKDDDLQWIIDNYFINYKIALNSALGLTIFDLFDRIGDEQKKANKNIETRQIIKFFSKNGLGLYTRKPILLPTEHEDFYKSIILDLAINDLQKRDFDYLGLAAICFQIQQYEVLKFEYDSMKSK